LQGWRPFLYGRRGLLLDGVTRIKPLALQQIVEHVFEPHGGPPRYIADTPGVSYLSLQAEEDPLIRRIFIPNCALVSPAHRMESDNAAPGGWRVYDDPEYPCDPLTDEQFAQRLRE
jgi:hypothetical protein